MSIEKMTFVNIVGNLNLLNECILKLIKFKMFHIEKIKEKATEKTFKSLDEQNPYAENLSKISEMLNILEIKTSFEDFEDFDICVTEKEEEFLKFSYDKITSKEKSINELKSKIENLKKSLEILEHIKNLTSNLNNLKNTNYVEIKFGKISKENYIKLSDFTDYSYFFIKQDEDYEFYWGFFVTQKKDKEITHNILKSVNFLEYELPNGLKENPENSKKEILSQIEILKGKIYEINTEKEKFKDVNFKNLELTHKKFKILNDVFNYRKFAKSNKKQFNICGFIPTRNINDFKLIFKEDGIVLEFLNQKENKTYSPPVKLRTCRIFKPFEMYITTYGTPQYESINPSSFVGLIYSLIFGIMFGDLGQGLVILLGGIVFWKKKKSSLGLILTRCGFSSAVFGAIYNSIFGFEGVLNYNISNILPFELLKPSNSIVILIISCLLGMFIILISIAINVILKLKNKKYGEALFSHNGLAGFVCYASCTTAVLCLIFLKKNIFSPVVVALTVILPLILIFFNIPLGNIFEKNKHLKTKKEKFTVSAAIFDMIDILLSYFTNTLSFLRIGGLALSHAALMLVVMEFEKMAINVNYIGNSVTGGLVVILGNAFVILLEGLIVSIQALRLIYYEMFSRFYQASGKPFTPININFKEQ